MDQHQNNKLPSYEEYIQDNQSFIQKKINPEETDVNQVQKFHRRMFKLILILSIFFIISFSLSAVLTPKLTGWILFFLLLVTIVVSAVMATIVTVVTNKANTELNNEQKKVSCRVIMFLGYIIVATLLSIGIPIYGISATIYKIYKSTKEESENLVEVSEEEKYIERKIYISILPISICALFIPAIFIILCSTSKDLQASFRSFDIKHLANGISKAQIVSISLFGIALLALITTSLYLFFGKKSVVFQLEEMESLGEKLGLSDSTNKVF